MKSFLRSLFLGSFGYIPSNFGWLSFHIFTWNSIFVHDCMRWELNQIKWNKFGIEMLNQKTKLEKGVSWNEWLDLILTIMIAGHFTISNQKNFLEIWICHWKQHTSVYFATFIRLMLIQCQIIWKFRLPNAYWMLVHFTLCIQVTTLWVWNVHSNFVSMLGWVSFDVFMSFLEAIHSVLDATNRINCIMFIISII